VESLLRKAFHLSLSCEGEGATAEDPAMWIDFMDTLSYLQVGSQHFTSSFHMYYITLHLCIFYGEKTTDFRGLSESERCATFLNLYHVMVLHGTLILGPSGWNSW
jgi:hypothetical protein